MCNYTLIYLFGGTKHFANLSYVSEESGETMIWYYDDVFLSLSRCFIIFVTCGFLPSSFMTPRQPISSCSERALSLLMSQYSTNFFTHFFGLDFLRSKRLNGLISFLPMSPLRFLSSWLKYQCTTRSSSVWLGSGSGILDKEQIIVSFYPVSILEQFTSTLNLVSFVVQRDNLYSINNAGINKVWIELWLRKYDRCSYKNTSKDVDLSDPTWVYKNITEHVLRYCLSTNRILWNSPVLYEITVIYHGLCCTTQQ